MEVWGPPEVDPARGNAHFQAYTCGIARNAASFLLQGGLDVAEVILIPHTCDALQGMASVLHDFIRPKQAVATLYVPRGARKADRAYLVAELRRLSEQLSAISGVMPTAAKLLEAVEREEAADEALRELAEGRDGIDLDDRSCFAALRAREYLPAERFVELAASLPRANGKRNGLPLMLSGIVPEPMDLFDSINTAGARVVADDLACVSRRLYPRGRAEDPFARMADSLLSGPLDPTRGSPIRDRAEALIGRMNAHGAKGLLVYDVKFCEPELFDLPVLREQVTAAGLAMLHVEFDMGGAVSQQTLTRIEAFVEMLQ